MASNLHMVCNVSDWCDDVGSMGCRQGCRSSFPCAGALFRLDNENYIYIYIYVCVEKGDVADGEEGQSRHSNV